MYHLLQLNYVGPYQRRKKFIENGVQLPTSGLYDFSTTPDWDKIHERFSNFEFFEREAMANGCGRDYLVMKSVFQQEQIPRNMRLHPDDARFHLKIAQMVEGCSRGQRDILGEILFLNTKIANRLASMGGSGKPPLPVPQSGKDLRRQFVSNKHSLLNNIPHPPVTFFKDVGIATCTLKDCLADFLARGIPFQSIVKSEKNSFLSDLIRECDDKPLLER